MNPYPLTHTHNTHARKMSVTPSVNPSFSKRATGATACLPQKWRTLWQVSRKGQEGELVFPLLWMRGGWIEFEVVNGMNIDGIYRSFLKEEMTCYM